jgi:hypothetical protein
VARRNDNEIDEEEVEEREEEREDLKAALMQARRKPRHFAIIAKGAEVLALLAQKKPFRDGALRQARREKRGKQIITGVCQGEGGTTMIFKVAGERPKVKKSKLRDFISAETGLMLKPQFGTLSESSK